jgi:hypothetical protein
MQGSQAAKGCKRLGAWQFHNLQLQYARSRLLCNGPLSILFWLLPYSEADPEMKTASCMASEHTLSSRNYHCCSLPLENMFLLVHGRSLADDVCTVDEAKDVYPKLGRYLRPNFTMPVCTGQARVLCPGLLSFDADAE